VCEGIPLSRSLQVRTPRAIFNVLNNAGVVAQNWQTGATTFGRITTLEAPRVARLGAGELFELPSVFELTTSVGVMHYG
jgi:triphosphoribosyl-dephospho-CoA synthetase